jgi:Family of unknown function (DUF6279)
MAFYNLISRFAPIRFFSIFLVVISVTSCTKIRLGYEYADWLVIYFVEDNFSLDKVQRAQAKDSVVSYFKWHRSQMLPAYTDFLSWTLVGLDQSLPPSKIDSCYKGFKALTRATLLPVIDQALILLSSLTPDQIEAWSEKQKKRNQKLHKDFSGNLEDRLEQRYEKIIDELEDWTGRLEPEQKAKIKVLNGTLPWNGLFWLENREKFQIRLLELLRSKAAPSEIRNLLEEYYLRPEKFRSKEYQKRVKEFEIRLRTIILVVYKMLTPEQKRHFMGQAEKLVADFNKLKLQE